MKTWHARLASAGRKLFPLRLLVGLTVLAGALELLSPTPFFDPHYRLIHLLAMLLITAGLGLRAWGAGSAGFHTRTARIEAPKLITGGAFAHLRNPIYGGSICIGVGMSTLIGDPKAFLFSAIAFGFLYFAIVPAEEEYLLQRFGADYLRYRSSVPRLLPRLRPWVDGNPAPFHWRAATGEVWILLLLILIYAALLAEEHLDRIAT